MFKTFQFFALITLETDNMITDGVGSAHTAIRHDADVLCGPIHAADALSRYDDHGGGLLPTEDLYGQQRKS